MVASSLPAVRSCTARSVQHRRRPGWSFNASRALEVSLGLTQSAAACESAAGAQLRARHLRRLEVAVPVVQVQPTVAIEALEERRVEIGHTVLGVLLLRRRFHPRAPEGARGRGTIGSRLEGPRRQVRHAEVLDGHRRGRIRNGPRRPQARWRSYAQDLWSGQYRNSMAIARSRLIVRSPRK